MSGVGNLLPLGREGLKGHLNLFKNLLKGNNRLAYGNSDPVLTCFSPVTSSKYRQGLKTTVATQQYSLKTTHNYGQHVSAAPVLLFKVIFFLITSAFQNTKLNLHV